MKYIIFAIVPFMVFAVPRETHAYIDIGLAGALFQAAYLIFFAALAFIAAPFLFFWKRIRNYIRRRFKKNYE